MDLKKYIRDIPDFPTPGILFRDITPLLMSPGAFRETIGRFLEQYEDKQIDAVVGIDARGFLFASPLAYSMRLPLIPVRKQGKLPFKTYSVTYELEYGSDAVEVHVDAIGTGNRVVIIDDLLATGGTMAAAAKLVEQTGAMVAGLAVVVELTGLGGRDALSGYEVFSILQY